MHDNLKDYILEHVWYQKDQIANSAQTEFDLGTPIDSIPDTVALMFHSDSFRINLETHSQLVEAVKAYKEDHKEKQKPGKEEVRFLIQNIYEYLKDKTKDFSNALFFRLDKADYEDWEIEALTDFYEKLRDIEYHFRFDLKNKIPECKQNCENCILSYKNGCRKENYSPRFEKWTETEKSF